MVASNSAPKSTNSSILSGFTWIHSDFLFQTSRCKKDFHPSQINQSLCLSAGGSKLCSFSVLLWGTLLKEACSYHWGSFYWHDLCSLSFISINTSSCCWALCPSPRSGLAILPSSFSLFGILCWLDHFQKFGLWTHSSWEDLHCQLQVDPTPGKVAGSFSRFQKNIFMISPYLPVGHTLYNAPWTIT